MDNFNVGSQHLFLEKCFYTSSLHRWRARAARRFRISLQRKRPCQLGRWYGRRGRLFLYFAPYGRASSANFDICCARDDLASSSSGLGCVGHQSLVAKAASVIFIRICSSRLGYSWHLSLRARCQSRDVCRRQVRGTGARARLESLQH